MVEEQLDRLDLFGYRRHRHSRMALKESLKMASISLASDHGTISRSRSHRNESKVLR